MVLVVNARFVTQAISGVQRYAIEICREIKRLNPDVLFVAPGKAIIHENLVEELGVVTFGAFLGHAWEQLELPNFLRKNNNPLLLNLANTGPILYGNKITVVHDLAYERFPETFSFGFKWFYKLMIPRIIYTSRCVITDSEFSLSEMNDVYGVNRNNVAIVHCSVGAQFLPRHGREFGGERYILAVSSINYQKNFQRLVEAFNLIKSKDVKLYLVGAINKNFADHKLLEVIEKNENILFQGRVSDDELVRLYSNAECFVYPSLYEGFGIPPLEAQACGCPCLVSDAASLPEVCGDSALYCDPYDVNDIRIKLESLLGDSVLRSQLIEKGFDNIKRFSWQVSAQKILALAGDLK